MVNGYSFFIQCCGRIGMETQKNDNNNRIQIKNVNLSANVVTLFAFDTVIISKLPL